MHCHSTPANKSAYITSHDRYLYRIDSIMFIAFDTNRINPFHYHIIDLIIRIGASIDDILLDFDRVFGWERIFKAAYTSGIDLAKKSQQIGIQYKANGFGLWKQSLKMFISSSQLYQIAIVNAISKIIGFFPLGIDTVYFAFVVFIIARPSPLPYLLLYLLNADLYNQILCSHLNRIIRTSLFQNRNSQIKQTYKRNIWIIPKSW